MALSTPASLSFDRHGEEPRTVIGVAPLVDIVLLLISFYLIVSNSIRSYEDPAVELPRMSSELVGDEVPAELVINLRADDTLTVNRVAVPLDGLTELLSSERERGTARGESLRVVIRADRRQRFERLNRVLEACRDAGITSTLLRAIEERGP